MKRNGKELTKLADGHPRRLADGRNAFRKMSPEQRTEFLRWIEEQGKADIVDAAERVDEARNPSYL